MTTSAPTHSGRSTPTLRRVSAQVAAAVNIPATGPVLLVTCGTLYAVRNPVIIEASATILANETNNLSFLLYRDGAEIDATQRFLQHIISTDEYETVSMHWWDTSPGNTPVYTLYAVASAWGGGPYNQAIVPTRMTAHT